MLKIAAGAFLVAQMLVMARPALARSVVVPAHSRVMLVPKRAFLASDVRVGTVFDLTMQDPLIAGGYVAIPDGARARAHVISTGPGLRIVFDWVQLPGRKIGLEQTPYDVLARGTYGKRHRYFFGLLKTKIAVSPLLSQQFPLEARTARRVHVATFVKATAAQRNAALRKLIE